MAMVQIQWYHLGEVNSPPILEPISVGIGMIWILTHGQSLPEILAALDARL